MLDSSGKLNLDELWKQLSPEPTGFKKTWWSTIIDGERVLTLDGWFIKSDGSFESCSTNWSGKVLCISPIFEDNLVTSYKWTIFKSYKKQGILASGVEVLLKDAFFELFDKLSKIKLS